MDANRTERGGPLPKKALVVVFSYHHGNTGKVAQAIANVLKAPVKTPREVRPEEIAGYDLVGFGSGIYGATFGRPLLDLAGRLPQVRDKTAFLFSTYGAPAFAVDRGFVERNHRQAREILVAKGYTVIGEFACAGWNTNSFLGLFGGINTGRPDAGDLRRAGEFAEGMKEKARQPGS